MTREVAFKMGSHLVEESPALTDTMLEQCMVVYPPISCYCIPIHLVSDSHPGSSDVKSLAPKLAPSNIEPMCTVRTSAPDRHHPQFWEKKKCFLSI